MGSWWRAGRSGERLLEWILRVGVAGCFIGHGAFGILGKEAWLPYFAVFGISESLAWSLMPVVGSLDILVGLSVLLRPTRGALAYAAGWALLTAFLRPMAGESAFETLERAGNFGVPLAFLLAVGAGGARGWRRWLEPVAIRPLRGRRRRVVSGTLRGTLALLLVGHGGLALTGKPLLLAHLSAVGLGPGALAPLGWTEIALGVAVAVRPWPALLVVALGWKVATEALFPLAGAPFWEFVERAGSYAAPLGLLALHPSLASRTGSEPVSSRSVARDAALSGIAFAALAAPMLLAPSATTRPAPAAGLSAALGEPPGDLRADTTLLGRLRRGGLVLACRHAITDRSRGDRRPVDYDDPSTQRVLSEEGRAQARRLGRVVRALEIPVGEVLTSPYARTEDSAILAFGRARLSRALVYGNDREQREGRRRLLGEAPERGNRVLMTHQGILYGNLEVERGSIREGDCLVVEPSAGGPRVLGRVGPEELADLGRGPR